MLESIIKEINNTTVDLGKHSNFLEIFKDVSKENNNTAVIFEDHKISYRELDILSNKYANYFIKKDIKNGTIVGVCLERNIDLLPVLLGILKTGACYIPMDPHFPKSRLSYMVDDSGLASIISQKALVEKLFDNADVDVMVIEDEKAQIDKEEALPPAIKIEGDFLAYIIYTSGSTGTPKGVQIQHRALLNLLLSMKKKPGITEDDKFLALATISFDMSVPELYLSFIVGATIVLATTKMARDIGRLIEYIDKNSVTMMQATSTSFQMFFDYGWKNSSLKKIVCGGEAVSADIANKLTENCDEVWNFYGPTETTVWSSAFRLRGCNQQPLIGKPIDNTVMIILDDQLNPVTIGETGELYIGGIGLSLGYLNRDELTSERFLTCPSEWGLDTDRLYKTGDVCRYHEDGNIEYIGRSDFQVKIRGYRIELGDIEYALMNNPSIHNAVVVAKELSKCNKQLAAYIIAKDGRDINVEAIKKDLSNILPTYMIPNLFMQVDEYPLTLNGKTDRKALALMDIDSSCSKPSEDLYRLEDIDPSDIVIIKKIESVLGRHIDTIESSFVALGGDSLSYIRVSLFIEKHIGYLPDRWEIMPLNVLLGKKKTKQKSKVWTYIDMTSLFRAIAITFVIMGHLGFNHLPDASVLFVLSGLSFGKFLRPTIYQKGNLNGIFRFIFSYGFPVFLWNALCSIQNHRFWLPDFFLLNTMFQKPGNGRWGYWFLDILTANILILSVVTLIVLYSWKKGKTQRVPNQDSQFKLDMTVSLGAIVLGVLQSLTGFWNGSLGSESIGPFPWLWPIAFGVAISSTTCTKERIFLTVSLFIPFVLTRLDIPGLVTYRYLPISFYLVMLLIIWIDRIRFPKNLKTIILEIASASLFIYIVHSFVLSELSNLGMPSIWPVQVLIGLISGVVSYRLWTVFMEVSGRFVYKYKNRKKKVLVK